MVQKETGNKDKSFTFVFPPYSSGIRLFDVFSGLPESGKTNPREVIEDKDKKLRFFLLIPQHLKLVEMETKASLLSSSLPQDKQI